MIELKDVVLAYEDRLILDHINLTIEDGETLVVLGGSGAGKSTILRLIIGLQKPTSGKVLVNGQDITCMTEDELNKVRMRMGMVFQYSALFDSMTVADNVAFGLKVHGKEKSERLEEIVANRLEMVGLPHIGNLMPSELSGGMKKRVSLARAIALNPDIILYDEPTSGLDPISSGTISRLIRSTQREFHCTSIVVTHDMQSAFLIADRIALLDKGKFIEISSVEDFKNSPNSKVQDFIHGESKEDFLVNQVHTNHIATDKEDTLRIKRERGEYDEDDTRS